MSTRSRVAPGALLRIFQVLMGQPGEVAQVFPRIASALTETGISGLPTQRYIVKQVVLGLRL